MQEKTKILALLICDKVQGVFKVSNRSDDSPDLTEHAGVQMLMKM